MKNFGLLTALSLICGLVNAQSFEGNMNSFETPLGMASVADIGSPASRIRDENFNRTEVQAPSFGFTATSVGNLINVVNTGSNNSTIINATQVNNGSQSIHPFGFE